MHHGVDFVTFIIRFKVCLVKGRLVIDLVGVIEEMVCCQSLGFQLLVGKQVLIGSHHLGKVLKRTVTICGEFSDLVYRSIVDLDVYIYVAEYGKLIAFFVQAFCPLAFRVSALNSVENGLNVPISLSGSY